MVDKELYDGTRKIIDERYTIKTKECTASPRESYLNDIGIKSLQIEIPYIDDIPLSLFSEISYNETDALRSFRSFFSKNIRAIDFSKISEIVDFEESMKEEVGKIQNKILREQKKVARKHFINVFGTSVALLVTLIVFNDQQELIECLAGLGSIGLGLKKFISDSTDYFVQKVDAEDNACWYLWLLNESKSS